MIHIKSRDIEDLGNNSIKDENLPTVASGENYEEALNNLCIAINADGVDTENCFLSVYVD